jgi:glutamate racemase
MLALFDSGIGGLTVLREVRKVYTGTILYLGDTLRAPYGGRSEEELTQFAKELLLYAKSHGATHFISACNSLSVNVTETILEEVNISKDCYTDMVLATSGHAQAFAGEKVFLLATGATIQSGAYRELLAPTLSSYRELALPLLAGALEKGDDALIQEALEILPEVGEGETLFLGCTHFPLALAELTLKSGDRNVIDPAFFVREEVRKWGGGEVGNIAAHLSGETTVFERVFHELFPNEPLEIRKMVF